MRRAGLELMRLKEAWRLSHREFAAFQTRSIATAVTVGALFGLLLAAIVIVQGLENVALRYARAETGGEVYLASEYDGDKDLALWRIDKYGGVVIESSSEVVTAKFDNVRRAYEYAGLGDAREMGYDARRYRVEEVRGTQLAVYRYFRGMNRDFVRPICVVLLVVSALVLAFTLAHLVSQSARTFALYRSLGASRGQILLIYFLYLLEICFWAMLLAIGVAITLAGVATATLWNYLTGQFSRHYPRVGFVPPILLGLNWMCAEVVAWILGQRRWRFCCVLISFPRKRWH